MSHSCKPLVRSKALLRTGFFFMAPKYENYVTNDPDHWRDNWAAGLLERLPAAYVYQSIHLPSITNRACLDVVVSKLRLFAESCSTEEYKDLTCLDTVTYDRLVSATEAPEYEIVQEFMAREATLLLNSELLALMDLKRQLPETPIEFLIPVARKRNH